MYSCKIYEHFEHSNHNNMFVQKRMPSLILVTFYHYRDGLSNITFMLPI